MLLLLLGDGVTHLSHIVAKLSFLLCCCRLLVLFFPFCLGASGWIECGRTKRCDDALDFRLFLVDGAALSYSFAVGAVANYC